MKSTLSAVLLSSVCAFFLAGCYNPDGPIPEDKKAKVAPLWSDEEVDQVVQITYESAPAIHQVDHAKMPQECKDVKFLRFKTRGSSNDASQADASLLLVPGVLEGANGFEYIGRQLVYMAKTFRDKDIEVWAMDRRANCLEDLTGLQLAEQAATVDEAADLILGYYYEGQEMAGKTFEGFHGWWDIPYVAQFGMEQVTEDMFAVIQHMVPDREVSHKKVFVGGHSLGGTHTSLFLAWDLDGDAATTDDTGANWVAGAVGFDTFIGSVNDGITGSGTDEVMDEIALESMLADAQAEAAAEGDTSPDAGYERLVRWLEWGLLPRAIDIPLIFSPEAIALPEMVGLLAGFAPDEENTVVHRLPQSAEVKNLFKAFHSKSVGQFLWGPGIEDVRYTNEALVGIMFDEHFSLLGFLQTSLGHMNGGSVVVKSQSGDKVQHIAADAGPSFWSMGQGPLYSWADMDEVGTPDDPFYSDATGEVAFTSIYEETSRMEDFIRALYKGESNLTEWYFPLRILIDSSIMGEDYAPQYGINSLHKTAYKTVPTILLRAVGPYALSGGSASALDNLLNEDRLLTVISLEGQSHLDPMFAAVNMPSLHQNEVADNLLDFLFQYATE